MPEPGPTATHVPTVSHRPTPLLGAGAHLANLRVVPKLVLSVRCTQYHLWVPVPVEFPEKTGGTVLVLVPLVLVLPP